jgi:hypothetical protein
VDPIEESLLKFTREGFGHLSDDLDTILKNLKEGPALAPEHRLGNLVRMNEKLSTPHLNLMLAIAINRILILEGYEDKVAWEDPC